MCRILQQLTAPLLAPYIHPVIPSHNDDNGNDDDDDFQVLPQQPLLIMPHYKVII